jgi:hypothetical protein
MSLALIPQSFDEALQFYSLIRSMRNDLPDGQWLELKDEVHDLIASEGKDSTLWNDSTKSWFLSILQENITRWL